MVFRPLNQSVLRKANQSGANLTVGGLSEVLGNLSDGVSLAYFHVSQNLLTQSLGFFLFLGLVVLVRMGSVPLLNGSLQGGQTLTNFLINYHFQSLVQSHTVSHFRHNNTSFSLFRGATRLFCFVLLL